MSKAYSEHCQIPEMERFAEIANFFTPLIIQKNNSSYIFYGVPNTPLKVFNVAKILWKSFALFKILLKYKVLGVREKNELLSKAKLIVQQSNALITQEHYF